MILDEGRGRLYGTDQSGGRVLVLALPDLRTLATIDVGQAAKPTGLALSPVGAELAVALTGAGNVALIDTNSLTLSGKLLMRTQYGDPRPAVLLYVKPGRLYVAGEGDGDGIHIFDTPTRTEFVTTGSTRSLGYLARMVLAADGSVYLTGNPSSPPQIYRIAPDDIQPTVLVSNRTDPVPVRDLVVRADGSAVYTAGGQVWSSTLQGQLGAFVAKGSCIEYVPMTERLFVCQEKGVAEVEAIGNYNGVATYDASAQPRVVRANAVGDAIYVSTDAGIDVIQSGKSPLAAPSATPTATATIARPSGGTNATATIALPAPQKAGIPALSNLVIDGDRDRLYGTDKVGGKLIVLALPALDQVAAIDLGQASQPTGAALSPDGKEIAVALTGAGHLALIDPVSLTVSGALYPKTTSGSTVPWDVRYSPDGRLFSTGNSASSSFEYVHIFDTKARVEIGKSRDIIGGAPRLAFTAGNTLYVADDYMFYRFAPADTRLADPTHTNTWAVNDFAVRPDGGAVYTAGGLVISGDLQTKLGAFNAKGTRIEYVPFTERLFICQGSTIIEVEATGNYNVVATHAVSATAGVARADAKGTVLYVSTDAGISVIPLGGAASH